MKQEELSFYRDLLGDIKTRVRQGQHRAALSANAEMIAMYWDIGRMIAALQKEEGWGAGVIPRLAADLKNELPEQKGFSERNLKYMIRFAREYGCDPILPQSAAKFVQQLAARMPDPETIVQQPAAQLQPLDSESVEIVPRAAAQLPLPPYILFGLPEDAPHFLCFASVSLLEKKHAAKLAATVKQAAEQSRLPCRLVILDTLARAMAGGDENNGKEMGAAVKSMDALRAATGAHVMHVQGQGDWQRGRQGPAGPAGAGWDRGKQKSANPVSPIGTRDRQGTCRQAVFCGRARKCSQFVFTPTLATKKQKALNH